MVPPADAGSNRAVIDGLVNKRTRGGAYESAGRANDGCVNLMMTRGTYLTSSLDTGCTA
jgi:hypothetical protein